MTAVVNPNTTTRPEGIPTTKVEFLEDYIYEIEGIGKGPLFERGAVYEFPDDLAQRFLRRGVAKRTEKDSLAKKYLVKAAPAKKDDDAKDESEVAKAKADVDPSAKVEADPVKAEPAKAGHAASHAASHAPASHGGHRK